MLKDSYGRVIDYLRISVIDRCNLRCVYCTPEEGVELLPREEILSYEEMLNFSRVAVGLGIRSIRLTGGEPLIRRDFIPFVEKLAKLLGLEEVTLTTNAILLEEYAEQLYQAGVRRVNIGFDTFDPAAFKKVTRTGDVTRAIAGIKKAFAVGFNPVKINVVVMRGVNDDLQPFVEMTREYPVYVRFIEYMPVSNGLENKFFVPGAEVRERLQKFGKLESATPPPGAGPTTRYYRYPGAKGAIGQISAMSEHFCPECSRLRLTADGKIRLCLFSEEEIDVKPGLRPVFNKDKIEEIIKLAVSRKPERYDLTGRDNNGRTMSQIGG